MASIAILDIGSGNLYSVEKAVRHVAQADDTVFLCTDATQLPQATHVILPGVGAFADCMQGLNALAGMRDALEKQVLQQATPFLGICVGMQMLLERGFEHGTQSGLGWFKGEVQPLRPQDSALKIPHMGWNELRLQQPEHPVLNGIANRDHAYFVHSYHCVVAKDEHDAIAVTAEYGEHFTAALARKNIFATQFHPEKSQKTGLRLLQNFLQQQHAH